MPGLSEEQEIFAATDTTEDLSTPAAEPVEVPAAPPEPEPAPAAGEVEPQTPQTEPQERHVPYAALKEEREARKALQAEVAELRSFLLQNRHQPQQQPQQPEAPVELWDDPEKYLDTRVSKALDPVQQALMFNARLVAEARYTPEKVNEAEEAFMAAVESRSLDSRDYEKVVSAPNRYHAAVEWFNNRPEAQRARLEAEIEQKLLAKYGIQPGQAPAGQRPAGAPSQSQQPTPPPLPSLNRSYGNAGNAQGGAITEEDIFNAAPAFGRRKA